MSPALLGTSKPITEDTAPPERPDDDILEEVRERRTEGTRAWQDVRREGTTDVMCVAGDVWAAMDPAGLKQRQDAMRPHLAPDEIGQYINQVGNDVRQNKRSIRATPKGNGANQKTANYRQGRIRQIEYESNAQRDVYSPIFEDALQRSYGFGRINAKHASPFSKNVELTLEAFPNPDVVIVDPVGAMLSPDCSKIQWAFILDASRTRKAFAREFPNATVTDFTDYERIAPDWIKGDSVTLAEYWLIEKSPQRVVFLKSDPARGVFAHKLGRVPTEAEIDDERIEEVPYVYQYLTNGVELLTKTGQKKRTPWPGKWIPLFSCFGKVLYVQSGVGTERRLLSMVRHMRQPVMYYSYIRTCQAEVIGSVPRATYVGYEGQFRGHETEWQKANHEPVPFLVAKPFTEATGTDLLPLPQRQNWDPPLQNLDMAAEGARRSIQAAAGTSPLPTEAQRVNQKSGKALDRIESSGQKGSYHFVDHLDGMITRVGVMLDDLIPNYDDAMGDVTIRKPDDQSAIVRINDPNDPESIPVSAEHQHDITISVGPYEADEREASSNFADTIVENAQLAQIVGPQKAAELIALAIRLKAVGPIGDQMADIISPKQDDEQGKPTPQQMQELQAQAQQMGQQLQEAQHAIETDQAKQQAHIEAANIKAQTDAATAQADADLKWRIAQLEAETELAKVRMQEATKLELAEYKLRAEQMQAEIDALEIHLGVKKQAAEQEHEIGMAGVTHAQGLEAADVKHKQQLEAGERSHEQALEESETGAQLAMQQAEHAAKIAPPEATA